MAAPEPGSGPGSGLGPGPVPRSDGESLLRSRKRNFSEAEVCALLRGIAPRRKKLLAAPEDKVPLWQRTLIWKQITEAVNTASGFRNRRTLGEIKKKWSDIKIEARKRLRVATERGDDAELRDTDKMILAILDPNRDPEPDQPIVLDPDSPHTAVKQESDPEPGLDPGPDPALPTILHVTSVKSEPLLSDSDLSSTSTSASTERAHNASLTTEHAQSSILSEHTNNTSTERAQIKPSTERAQIEPSTERAQTEPVTERAQTEHCTERAQTEPLTQWTINDFTDSQTDHVTEHAQMNHVTEHAQMNHVTEHAQVNHVTEHTQCVRPDMMMSLLQNQQLILETLRNMAQTFSEINSSLKDISHSLKNR